MKYPSHWRYIQKVRQVLLGRGERGIKFHDLNQLTRTKVFKQDDLRELLIAWKLREWVQSFLVTGQRGRAPTIWRATTLLRDDWSSLNIPATDAVVDDVEVTVEPSLEDLADLSEQKHQDASRSKTFDHLPEDLWTRGLG
jgi:hypothetical protein